MNALDIIEKKRDCLKLTKDEINYLIGGYSKDLIPDYQMSAFLMASYLNGLDYNELAYMTQAMTKSGETYNLSSLGNKVCDKHSTGGVADTTTLIVAPLVASVGVKVAKLSGRALGFTGGTIDKLESIPGFNTVLDEKAFIDQVENKGLAVCAASSNLCPADKKIYALRDVTGTVPSIPLIASSIMSKKLAAGAPNIVLDVKCGNGAFMRNVDDAIQLGKLMVEIAELSGRHATALITDMNQPLGDAVGNSLEIIEAIEILKGKRQGRLLELSIQLGAEMMSLCKITEDIEKAKELLIDAINSGKAIDKLKELISAQGGDTRIIDDYKYLPQAKFKKDIIADKDGYISEFDTQKLGVAVQHLGAGRLTKNDQIDLSVGIWLNKKIGNRVEKGDTLYTIYYNKDELLRDAETMLEEAVLIDKEFNAPSLIYQRVSDGRTGEK